MTITARRLPASLLVVLAARTFGLSPSRPPDDPVPSEDTGDDSAPGSDVAFSIDWTEVADSPLARFEGQSAVVNGNIEAFILKTKGNLRAFETYASTHDLRREKVEGEIKELEEGLERLKAWDEAVLRERARSDKHTARVLLPDSVTGEEETRLLYIRDVGLIVAGPGLTTRPNAIETPTQRKRRKDRMKGKLEPLVRFGAFEVFSERAWQAVKVA